VSNREWTEQVRVANEEFTRDCEALLPRVREVFEVESKRFRHPSDDHYRRIAQYLVNMRAREGAKPRDYYYERKTVDAARRAGQRFLAALEAVKDPGPTDLWIAGMPALDVPKVIAQVRHALWCLGETRDPFRELDELAKSAWAAANGGRWPRSIEHANSPRVEAVAALYELANEPDEVSRSTVSKILKRERRRGAL
jgi:hypothetical protein